MVGCSIACCIHHLLAHCPSFLTSRLCGPGCQVPKVHWQGSRLCRKQPRRPRRPGLGQAPGAFACYRRPQARQAVVAMSARCMMTKYAAIGKYLHEITTIFLSSSIGTTLLTMGNTIAGPMSSMQDDMMRRQIELNASQVWGDAGQHAERAQQARHLGVQAAGSSATSAVAGGALPCLSAQSCGRPHSVAPT